MKKSQIAVQLYTLRKYLKTPGSVDRAFAKIRAIGYEAVQVSGVAAPYEDVKKAADANGLVICASHSDCAELFKNPLEVVEKQKILGCTHTAFSCAEEYQVMDRESTLEFAAELEKAAVKLAEHGITLSYHNHNMEFARFGKDFALDLIYTHAPHLLAEMDTYWVQLGGCDPAEWVAKYAGRQILFHLKDFFPLAFSSTMCPVGTGNLNWEKIIPAAEQAGVRHFIVEQDHCSKDPFESLKDSYVYLTENFVD
ncbi:MAG: sugar phosphate isomerase/epimerase [Lentisphaeria bacterium]|nr:sugar phosphate isomerase/epimerase [Lentisphaeria bacterium]